MALLVDLNTLRTAIVEYAYGGAADYSLLATDEQAAVDRCLDEGLRNFYECVPMAGRQHDWSFLEVQQQLTLNAPYSTGTITVVDGVVTGSGTTFPSWAADGMMLIDGVDYPVNIRTSAVSLTLVDTTLDVAAGTAYQLHQDDYDLPSTFGGLLGPITFRNQDNASIPVAIVDAGRILLNRQLRSGLSYNQPWLCAIRAKTHDATVGSRQELLFWPAVSAVAIINIPSRYRPATLSAVNLYPWGGDDHGGTILAACRAAAEMTFDRQKGPMHEDFLSKLAASIKRDGRNNKPQYLGRIVDTSDGPDITDAGRNLALTEVVHTGFNVH